MAVYVPVRNFLCKPPSQLSTASTRINYKVDQVSITIDVSYEISNCFNFSQILARVRERTLMLLWSNDIEEMLLENKSGKQQAELYRYNRYRSFWYRNYKLQ